VAVVILLSDIMQVSEAQFKTIGITPLDDTASKKQMMELFIKKVKHLADKSRAVSNAGIRDFGKNFEGDRESVIVYILTQSRENDDVFNIMEADGFYNYTGSFLFSQVLCEIIRKTYQRSQKREGSPCLQRRASTFSLTVKVAYSLP
jgi:hypothetical protein